MFKSGTFISWNYQTNNQIISKSGKIIAFVNAKEKVDEALKSLEYTVNGKIKFVNESRYSRYVIEVAEGDKMVLYAPLSALVNKCNESLLKLSVLENQKKNILNKIKETKENLDQSILIVQKKRNESILNEIYLKLKSSNISVHDAVAFLDAKEPKVEPEISNSITFIKKVVPIKYRNNETGDTWTGRGLKPRWLTKLCNNGIPQDKYLIQ